MKVFTFKLCAWLLIFTTTVTSKSKAPLCAEVIRSDTFSTKRHDPKEITVNFISVQPEECYYDHKNPLIIDLKRVMQISEIGLNTKLSSEGTHVFMRLRSGSSANFDQTGTCELTYGTPVNNSNVYIRCEASSHHNQGLVNADMIEIVPLKGTTLKPRGIGNPWLTLKFQSFYNNECLPPGHYADQALQPDKKFYKLGDVVKYVCIRSESTMEGQNNRSCETGGLWTGSTPKCYFKNIQYTAKLDKCNVEGEGLKVLRFKFSEEIIAIARLEILFSNRPRRPADWTYFNVVVSVEDSQASWFFDELTERSASYKLNGNLTISCQKCTVKLTMQMERDKIMYSNPVQVKLHVHKKDELKDNEDKRISCPPPDEYFAMSNSYRSNNFRFQNGKIVKPCMEGYYDKDTNFRCLDNGSWSGKHPQCELMSCPRPLNVQNANWKYVEEGRFHQIRFSCYDGFFKKNESVDVAKCDPINGTWGSIIECAAERKQALIIGGISAIMIILVVLALVCCHLFRRKEKGKRKLLEKTGPASSTRSLQGKNFKGPRPPSLKTDLVYDDIGTLKISTDAVRFYKRLSYDNDYFEIPETTPKGK